MTLVYGDLMDQARRPHSKRSNLYHKASAPVESSPDPLALSDIYTEALEPPPLPDPLSKAYTGCSRTLPLDQFRSRFRSGEVKTCQRCRDTDTRSKAKAKAQANTQAQALPRDPQPAPHSDQNKHPFCNEYPFENKRLFQNKHLIPLSPIKSGP
ncbi:hypothetical protein N7465_003827 [Penicillium sp. CMV-2018d]|nr:hypothetical protein N7465_003827 [Penicillium sp. CMV-2018d]